MSDFLIHQLVRDRQRTLMETATACHQAKAARAIRRRERQRAGRPAPPVGPTNDDAA